MIKILPILLSLISLLCIGQKRQSYRVVRKDFIFSYSYIDDKRNFNDYTVSYDSTIQLYNNSSQLILETDLSGNHETHYTYRNSQLVQKQENYTHDTFITLYTYKNNKIIQELNISYFDKFFLEGVDCSPVIVPQGHIHDTVVKNYYYDKGLLVRVTGYFNEIDSFYYNGKLPTDSIEFQKIYKGRTVIQEILKPLGHSGTSTIINYTYYKHGYCKVLIPEKLDLSSYYVIIVDSVLRNNKNEIVYRSKNYSYHNPDTIEIKKYAEHYYYFYSKGHLLSEDFYDNEFHLEWRITYTYQ